MEIVGGKTENTKKKQNFIKFERENNLLVLIGHTNRFKRTFFIILILFVI